MAINQLPQFIQSLLGEVPRPSVPKFHVKNVQTRAFDCSPFWANCFTQPRCYPVGSPPKTHLVGFYQFENIPSG